MRSLTDHDLVEVWEQGNGQPPFDRALTLLGRAHPDLTSADLARLPLGALHQRLLDLHAAVFGRHLDGTACCPECGDRHEFRLAIADLQTQLPSAMPKDGILLEEDEWRVEASLPTIADLAAASACEEATEARSALLARCIRKASRREVPVPPDDLPDSIVRRLSERLSQLDPGAEILIQLQCTACGQPWSATLEPGEFVWSELSALVRRLLYDVHTLARAYGWTETEILRIGPARRQVYLDLVGTA